MKYFSLLLLTISLSVISVKCQSFEDQKDLEELRQILNLPPTASELQIRGILLNYTDDEISQLLKKNTGSGKIKQIPIPIPQPVETNINNVKVTTTTAATAKPQSIDNEEELQELRQVLNLPSTASGDQIRVILRTYSSQHITELLNAVEKNKIRAKSVQNNTRVTSLARERAQPPPASANANQFSVPIIQTKTIIAPVPTTTSSKPQISDDEKDLRDLRQLLKLPSYASVDQVREVLKNYTEEQLEQLTNGAASNQIVPKSNPPPPSAPPPRPRPSAPSPSAPIQKPIKQNNFPINQRPEPKTVSPIPTTTPKPRYFDVHDLPQLRAKLGLPPSASVSRIQAVLSTYSHDEVTQLIESVNQNQKVQSELLPQQTFIPSTSTLAPQPPTIVIDKEDEIEPNLPAVATGRNIERILPKSRRQLNNPFRSVQPQQPQQQQQQQEEQQQPRRTDESSLLQRAPSNTQQDDDGNYHWKFETADGARHEQSSYFSNPYETDLSKRIQAVRGTYTVVDPKTGKSITVNYVADETGYHPTIVKDDD